MIQLREFYETVSKSQDEPKIKFLSAFRIFRKVKAPNVKEEYPNLTGKERQCIIWQMWKDLPGDIKYLFVIKSRLEEEKARFQAKAQVLKQKMEMTPIKEDSTSYSDSKKQGRSPLK